MDEIVCFPPKYEVTTSGQKNQLFLSKIDFFVGNRQNHFFFHIRKVCQTKFILVVGILKIPQIDDSAGFQTQHMDFLSKKRDFFQKNANFFYFFIKFSKCHINATNDLIVIKIKLDVF